MAIINGTANNDTLNGTFLYDSLSGKGGDDTLYGHQGNDILNGGTGENHLDGGIGADFVDYRWVEDTLSVFVNLATGQSSYHASGGGVQTADTLVDIEAVVAGPGDDTLIGDAGYNTLNGGDGDDSISGGGQSDLLVGGDGRDTLDGGSGEDYVSYILYFGKMVVDLIQGLAKFPGTQLPADQLISIERVYTGKGNDTIKGGSEENIFKGGPDNDKLIGRGGDDTLQGEDGKDKLYGGPGDDYLDGWGKDDKLFGGGDADRLFGGRGDDTLDGGENGDELHGEGGRDTASYKSSLGGVTVNLKVGQASSADAAGDKLTGIENLIGSAFKDVLTGDNGRNKLVGGDSRDVLDGHRKNDQLFGGDGKDTLYGGADQDDLDGGRDNDVLVGGGGLDEFTFKRGYDRDTIKDLSPRQGDTVVLKGLGVKNIKQLKDLAEKAGKDVVIDFGRGDELTLEDFSKSDLSQVFFI